MSDGLFYDVAVLRVIRAVPVSKGTRAEQDLEDEKALDVTTAETRHILFQRESYKKVAPDPSYWP